MTTTQQTAGQRIRAAREAAGLSREKLARLVDCTAASIVRWELDTNLPKLSMALALSKELNIPIEYLCGGK